MKQRRKAFSLAQAIKNGVAWTRDGHMVIIRSVGPVGAKYPVKGLVTNSRFYNDESWMLSGRYSDLGKHHRMDLFMDKPTECYED